MALVLVACVWGLNPPAMKVGLLYLPPLTYNALRLLLATLATGVVLALTGSYRTIDRSDIKGFVLLSLVGFFVFQLFLTAGVERTTAGNASLLLALIPVSVVVINRLCGLEAITLPVALGIAASLLGVVLIVIGSGREITLDGDHWQGALLMLVAQLSYGYYTVFSKPLMAKYSAYQVTACVLIVSTVLYLLLSLPEMARIEWRHVHLHAWLSVIYSGLFPLCVGNFLWLWGVGKIGSARTSLYNNLSPVFAIVAGYLLLGETFGLLQSAGAAVIFWGLYLTRSKAVFLPFRSKDSTGRQGRAS
jgi:drug/metabolite transporter (DMT)-like permease